MTLLIGTVSDKHAVITADGLSRVNPITGAGLGSGEFQKIFPVPGLPVAFVHHGLNIIGGNTVVVFLASYIRGHREVIAAASIEEIAEDLRTYASQDVQRTLCEPSNIGAIGFWVVGFSPGKRKPELYEICWPDKPHPYRHDSIVLGGDALQFIRVYLDQPLGTFRPDKVRTCSIALVQQYHRALYKQAEAKQQKTTQVIFGGHQHQLIVLKHGWKWEKPPK